MFRVEGNSSRINQPEDGLGETLLKTLSPENVVDAAGIERTIYTFKDKQGKPVRVLFYGCEELSTATPDESKSLFLVEQSPRALLDLAVALGAESPELEEFRRLISQEKVNDGLEKMLDQVIAGKMLDDQGELKKTTDTEGEALLMLALTGNQQAAEVLERKRSLVFKQDRDRQALHIAKEKKALEKSSEQALRPEELVAVHMTKYRPRQSDDGQAWELQTTFEATKRQVPRITQHFTLNHPVVSAGLYGSWEDAPIAILIPFERMLKANGKPACLNTVDTFWEVSPGRRSALPEQDTYIVEPGSIPEAGRLFSVDGQRITYKNTDIKPEDVTALAKGMNQYDCQAIEERFRRAFAEAFFFYNSETGEPERLIPEEDFNRLTRVFGARDGVSPHGAFSWGRDKDIEFLPKLKEHSIKEVIESILAEAKIESGVGQETVARLVKEIETFFVFKIKELVIENAIREMGYKVHGGGMWAWDNDSFTATEQTRLLGAELGVWVGPHSAHESSNMETLVGFLFKDLKLGETSVAEHHRSVQEAIPPGQLAKLSPAMRRMLYEVGAVL